MKRVFAYSWLLTVCILSMAGSIPCFSEEKSTVNSTSAREHSAGLKCYNSGNYGEAIVHFEQAYKLDNRNNAALFSQGLCLSKLRRYREAAEQLSLVLKQNPNNEKALKMYPSMLAMAGETEKALSAFDAGIEAFPDDYYLYWTKARFYLQLGEYETAIPLHYSALEKDTGQTDVYKTLGYAYRQLKRYADALTQYDKAIELKPDDIELLYLRTQTLMDLGRADEAYEAALKVLARNGDHARARLIVADYQRNAGHLAQALEEYERAARNIETKAYAEYYLGIIRERLEDIEIEKEWEIHKQLKK